MLTFKEYKDYLQDNPNRYWFKRKIYGWGWTPATWQGWLSIFLYAFILVTYLQYLGVDSISLTQSPLKVALPFIILTALLIVLCYWKGEKPQWQWGIKKDDQTPTT